MEVRNAIITKAEITNGDHGVLTAWLHLNYGGAGQGFGGHALYLPKTFSHHELKSYAGHFIWRVMEIAGVERWDQSPGKSIRVNASHSAVHTIGHIIKDDWFCPVEDFKGGDDD